MKRTIEEIVDELKKGNMNTDEVILQLNEHIDGYKIDDDEKEVLKNNISENNERWELALKGSRDGLWDWNIASGHVYYSPRWEEMFGIKKGEAEENLETMSEVVHPDDIEGMYSKVQEYLKGLTSHYSHDFRMYNKQGEMLWTRHRASAIFNKEGNPVRMIGTTADISDIKNKEKEINKALKEKETLLKEVNHRVKNNLQTISSLINMQKNSVKDDNAKRALAETSNRIYAMASIHELLYKSNQFNNVHFDTYIKSLMNHISTSYDIDDITIETEISNFNFSLDFANNCGMIIMELITNSIKYAFPKKQKGTIFIKIEEENLSCKLTISDNGIGFPKGLNYLKSKRLGLQIVNSLTEQLDGEMQLIETTTGTTFEMTFKNTH